MRTLYLIRHGQASFGTADYDRLSSIGAEQSRLLGAWFKRCGIDVHHAIAGGSKRHVQTAESFFAGYGEAAERMSRLQRDPDFNEVDHLDMLTPSKTRQALNASLVPDGTASMTFAEFKAALVPAYYRWTSGLYDHEYEEPFPVFSARCAGAAMRAVDLASPGDTVVTFTSGGTIAMICRQVLGLGDEQTTAITWGIGNTSVTRLVWDENRFALMLFNSTAHLDHVGDAGLITLT